MWKMAGIIVWWGETKRFHVVMFEERPMPGPYDPDAKFIRFKSRGHHTTGAETFEEAQGHIQELLDNPHFTGDEKWVLRDKVLPVSV